jgi:hypothetical protein
MSPRTRALSDGHDRVDGVLVGSAHLGVPDPDSGAWGELRFAYDALRECSAVVSYVADAEARHGFLASAEHYRRICSNARDALPMLRRLVVGSDRLPITRLDELHLGVNRLSAGVEEIVRLLRPAGQGV